jgi:universal stress protein E
MIGSRRNAVHAYAPVPPSAITQGASSPAVLAQVAHDEGASAARKLADAVRGAAIPLENQHVVGRNVPDAIEQVAAQFRSSIVVMGEVARSGLKGVLIGNTAERVLDQLGCDILLVKPPRPLQAQHKGPVPALAVESVVIAGA